MFGSQPGSRIDVQDLLGFVLLSVEETTVGSWWQFMDVRSPFYRLYLVTEGEASVTTPRTTHILRNNDMILIPSEAECSYSCPDHMTHIHVNFYLDSVIAPEAVHSRIPGGKTTADELTILLFRRLLQLNSGMRMKSYNPYLPADEIFEGDANTALDPDNSSERLESDGILRMLFSRFLAHDACSCFCDFARFSRIRTALSLMHAQPHKQFALQELAESASMNRTYFSDYFAQALGVRPSVYLENLRIKKACRLLAFTDRPIKRVADDVGYADVHYFMRVFKRNMGTPPGKYRQIHQGIAGKAGAGEK